MEPSDRFGAQHLSNPPMAEIIKKLKTLQMGFASVAHNTKFKHNDPAAQQLGESRICDNFTNQIAEIIKLAESNVEIQ